MAKSKILIICASLLILLSVPRSLATVDDWEPSFQSPHKHISNVSLETVLAKNSTGQINRSWTADANVAKEIISLSVKSAPRLKPIGYYSVFE